ncbi:hypothetical protein MKZ38_009997 [Zalerion maritima]|uniref:DUF1479-domain-containing protein n=1 Tax=Zalerion maritima TaxID=339359 RepID=A0AAD5RG83_9PEZI|nr:hypothetical protein MKZ38_009997 [Zalerion maritima]
MGAMSAPKREGNIGDSFVSLSGAARQPLPQRYLDLKKRLIAGHERKVADSWNRLLPALAQQNTNIAQEGSSVIPSVAFQDLARLEGLSSDVRNTIRHHGCAVVRGVIPEAEAREYKNLIESYLAQNPGKTNAFPKDNPQVWELYWTRAQVEARGHPNMLAAQKGLMAVWDKPGPEAEIDLGAPVSYADRLRIRQPGDATFALGPHMDGGSVERWEKEGYGLGGVYDTIFEGKWEDFSPWLVDGRIPVVQDRYQGLGACSAFRMFQAWLSMSPIGPGEGTLLVYPDVKLSTAYLLLRPFFKALKGKSELDTQKYLDPSNWVFCGEDMDTDIQGATPGHGQELNDDAHPHLELTKTMTPMPQLRPGDFVVWHCDGIHAVDPKHRGTVDSSVLYIPVCPLTQLNARYLVRQRDNFRNGFPGPDFPGGKGESEHVGRVTEEDAKKMVERQALEAFGLEAFDETQAGLSDGARKVRGMANEMLQLS